MANVVQYHGQTHAAGAQIYDPVFISVVFKPVHLQITLKDFQCADACLSSSTSVSVSLKHSFKYLHVLIHPWCIYC